MAPEAQPLTHPSEPDQQAEGPCIESLLDEALSSSDAARRESLRQEVVILSLDLADRVARRYAGRGIDVEDLVQVARLGLVKATAGYAPGRGAGFAAYAVPTMSGEIKRHFRDSGWAIRPPRRLQELRAATSVSEQELRQVLCREPTSGEVATLLGVPVADVDEARVCAGAYSALSLDQPGPSGTGPVDVAAVGDAFSDLDTSEALRSALRGLGARDLRIVRMRFVEERTQNEIGEAIGVSQMQVSRLLASIIGRLRLEVLTGAAA